ncbi:MAG: hypothetical protein QOJ24_2369 [Mycobacterium sp.]|jgi:hypothetical protein|nr:hypothetical protein [Mycobacterium sp.]
MSVDNISDLGTHGLDELVPSRYAVSVGDIDVLVISDGVLPITALTFAGDAVFAPGFGNPEWHNGFEHDPEEAARVRIRLLRELAASGESMVATHLPFPSACRVKAAGDVFRCVPTAWDY